MESLTFHGDAFSDYYLTHLIWEEPALQPLLGTESVQSSYRRMAAEIARAQRALHGREQARSTRHLLLNRLCDVLGWTLSDEETVETAEGTEDAGAPLLIDGEATLARVRALGPDAPLDLPPMGIHRRFAPSLSMVRVLEERQLAWGILLNAYELRLIRRAEGFIASHISFDLTAIAEGRHQEVPLRSPYGIRRLVRHWRAGEQGPGDHQTIRVVGDREASPPTHLGSASVGADDQAGLQHTVLPVILHAHTGGTARHDRLDRDTAPDLCAGLDGQAEHHFLHRRMIAIGCGSFGTKILQDKTRSYDKLGFQRRVALG